MKKILRLVSVLICLTLAISLLPSVSAAPKYSKIKLTTSMLQVGKYTNTDLTGEIVNISANPNYEQEITCLIDKGLRGGYWSKAIKYKDLKDNGGSTVPVILLDMTNDGQPTNVAAVELSLRHYFDCAPLHIEVQIATDTAGTNWVSVLEQDDILWMSQTIRFDFAAGNVAAYKLRILFYDIDEPNIEMDNGTYETLAGDETRFTLAEIALYNLPEGTTPETTAPSTQPSTQKPTDPVATEDPKTTDPTATEDPNAPTEAPETTDPEATEDPNAPVDPTDDPVVGPTEEPTEAPTVAPTDAPKDEEPTNAPENNETQAPTNAPAAENNDAAEESKGGAGLIIGIVAAVIVLGVVAFVIIKKKK